MQTLLHSREDNDTKLNLRWEPSNISKFDDTEKTRKFYIEEKNDSGKPKTKKLLNEIVGQKILKFATKLVYEQKSWIWSKFENILLRKFIVKSIF